MARKNRPSKNRKNKAHQNKTRHWRTVADPHVQTMISDLRVHWKGIDDIARGDRLRQFVDAGCSGHGLAKIFGVCETTVRRYMTLAALPAQVQEAVRTGYSEKRILNAKAQKDRQEKREARLALEARTGELSDRLADVILAFCKAIDGIPPAPIDWKDLEKFLNEVRRVAWNYEEKGFRFAKLPKRLSLKQRFRVTCPAIETDFFYAHLCEWLGIILLTEEPEREIWQTATNKANKRAKELMVKNTKSFVQRWKEEAQRKYELATAPLSRRSQPDPYWGRLKDCGLPLVP